MPGALEQMRKADISPLAGLPAPKEMLVDLARLEQDYFARRPDVSDSNQRVKFGTSGHRGSPLSGSFTEAHILAIKQAICDYRKTHGPDGPLYLGKDTHAVSEPAQQTALEVPAANGVHTIVQRGNLATPTAGASFLRFDGSVWATDKDGLIMDLLAAEITARTGKDPGQHYRDLAAEFGAPFYERIEAPATAEQKEKLRRLSPDAVKESSLAGEPIVSKLTRAPGNDAPIGGLKVITSRGWFAARPSGTENVYKIYAESFDSEERLNRIVDEAQSIVDGALQGEGRA